jgi:hypothetical protein
LTDASGFVAFAIFNKLAIMMTQNFMTNCKTPENYMERGEKINLHSI